LNAFSSDEKAMNRMLYRQGCS